ncbi:MAG TPA: hypothetical protein VLG13_01855 [Patescibacteria group bacterium]|nr:hypothetical protein [Patescibacteria group bacterium]
MLNFVPRLLPRNAEQRRADIYRKLLRYEAELGGRLFGRIPEGHRREFFCLDKSTWVWHEEWTDQKGKHQVVTTRYIVRPNVILKSQDNNTYQPVARDELLNLYRAAKLYRNKVGATYQQMLQTA